MSLPTNDERPWVTYIRAVVRERYGGNAAALARDIGVNRAAVSRWLKGSGPQIEQLRRLSEVTGDPLILLLRIAFGIQTAPPQSPESAIEADEKLDRAAKDALLAQLQLLRERYGLDPANRLRRAV